MRTSVMLALLVLGASTAGQSQEVRVARPYGVSVFSGGSVGKLGMTVGSGSVRDTLGLLVTSVTADGPAERAGIIEGDRLIAANGVPLTLSPADAGEPDMSTILRRRLEREMSKVEGGEQVTLRVWSAGRTREVRVNAEEAHGIGAAGAWTSINRADSRSRPAVGITLSATGTIRDTLGVFVSAVTPDGPAERAGIIEGHRIASINGVDLRVPAADAGDAMVAGTRSTRLAREVEKLEAGETVRLRVWSDGRYRDVRVELGRFEDVYEDRGGMTMFGGSGGAALVAPNVILRSVPGIAPGRVEPLDSLWHRRHELRRSVDPRLFDDSTGAGGVYQFRFNDEVRRQLEQSLEALRRFQYSPPVGSIITRRITM